MASPAATDRRDGLSHRLLSPIERFLATEAASGVILVCVALIAFIWANSAAAPTYEALKGLPLGIRVGAGGLEKPLILWINDLLMAIFFFLVGLEIKRELMVGELNGWKQAALPIVGAVGGMVAPAMIYVALTSGTALVVGWGVPMATDIAFAVGILALLGSRVPAALKVFLLALAIVDDLGAVIVIALFYTADVDATMLTASLALCGLAMAYGRAGGGRPAVFVVLGAAAWYCMLKSGVHATIAGVLMALAVPLVHRLEPEALKKELHARIGGSFEEVEVRLEHLEEVVEQAKSPLHSFEHALAPYVAFLIMPIFALFNAGVAVTATGEAPLTSMATAGTFLGLLIGKPLGIVGLVWLTTMLGITRLPPGIGWMAMTGISFLAAIGFTMALFIAALAFPDPTTLDQAKIGVLAASVIAAVLGLLLLHRALPAAAAR